MRLITQQNGVVNNSATMIRQGIALFILFGWVLSSSNIQAQTTNYTSLEEKQKANPDAHEVKSEDFRKPLFKDTGNPAQDMLAYEAALAKWLEQRDDYQPVSGKISIMRPAFEKLSNKEQLAILARPDVYKVVDLNSLDQGKGLVDKDYLDQIDPDKAEYIRQHPELFKIEKINKD